MDKKGFKAVEKAIGSEGTVSIEECDNVKVGKDEDVAFVDVLTYSPAGVLNGLHEAGLLRIHDGRPRVERAPRLQLIQAVHNETEANITMTFLDCNSEDAPDASDFIA